MDPTTKEEEVERAIRMLRTALRLLGFTNREIERRLGYTPSYLTRLFSGQIELRFEHIVDIVSAMGMTVDEFFRFAYPDRLEKLTEPAERLNKMLEEMRPTPPPPEKPGAWGEEEYERTIVSVLTKIAQEEDEKIKDIMDKLRQWDEEVRALRRYLPRAPRKRRSRPGRPKAPAGPASKKKSPA